MSKDNVVPFNQMQTTVGGVRILTEGEIPTNIVIPCPMLGFGIGKASKRCTDCDYFKGLLEVSADADKWKDQFRVLCAYPIARRVDEFKD